MAVDPRQVIAGVLTVTMFVMLGNMIKRDHFGSIQVCTFYLTIATSHCLPTPPSLRQLPFLLFIQSLTWELGSHLLCLLVSVTMKSVHSKIKSWNLFSTPSCDLFFLFWPIFQQCSAIAASIFFALILFHDKVETHF